MFAVCVDFALKVVAAPLRQVDPGLSGVAFKVAKIFQMKVLFRQPENSS